MEEEWHGKTAHQWRMSMKEKVMEYSKNNGIAVSADNIILFSSADDS
jgi:hypothetical protein